MGITLKPLVCDNYDHRRWLHSRCENIFEKKLLLLFGQALTLFGQLVLGLGWVVLYTVGGTGVVYR